MRVTVKVGLLCAALWIVIKYTYHLLLPDQTDLTPMILLNMLCLLLSVSIGLYLHKKKEGVTQGNALSDIKAAMTAGVPYTLTVALFTYFYYAQINPEFNKHQLAEVKTAIAQELKKPEQVKKLKAENPEFQSLNIEEIERKLYQGPETMYTAQSTFVLMLLGLILLSTFYAILVTVSFRRVLFRQ